MLCCLCDCDNCDEAGTCEYKDLARQLKEATEGKAFSSGTPIGFVVIVPYIGGMAVPLDSNMDGTAAERARRARRMMDPSRN